MSDKGIMEQIRDHLVEGKSSGEVIGLGYAPGSVYKVQRQIARRNNRPGSTSTGQESVQGVGGTTSPNPEIEARISQLENEVANIQEMVDESPPGDDIFSASQPLGERLKLRLDAVLTQCTNAEKQLHQRDDDLQNQITELTALARSMKEMLCVVSLLTYHLDVHHRQTLHNNFAQEPIDVKYNPNNAQYQTLVSRLREYLDQATLGAKPWKRLALPVKLNDVLGGALKCR